MSEAPLGPESGDTTENDGVPAVESLNEDVLHPAGGRTVADFARSFSALGHPLRLGALYTLYENGECTHGELADALGTEGNGLNHHLNDVVETPLVRKTPSEEDGRKMIYRLTPLGERMTEYVLDMMAAEREAIETEYAAEG